MGTEMALAYPDLVFNTPKLPENARLNGKIKFKGKELSQEDKEEIRGKGIVLVPQSVNFLDPLMKISDIAIGHCETEEEKKAKKIKLHPVLTNLQKKTAQ